jgi:hypothetical protein
VWYRIDAMDGGDRLGQGSEGSDFDAGEDSICAG